MERTYVGITTEQELENMELHKLIMMDDYTIQKVIGGWIYWKYNHDISEDDKNSYILHPLAGVFVPEVKS